MAPQAGIGFVHCPLDSTHKIPYIYAIDGGDKARNEAVIENLKEHFAEEHEDA